MSASKTSPFPGVPAVLDGSAAVAECEGEASDAAAEAPARPATRMGALWSRAAGEGHANAFGRPLLLVEAESEPAAVSAVAGLALTGLRTTGFVSGAGLLACRQELAAIASKHLATVLNVACGGGAAGAHAGMAGHEGYHAAADSGFFQFFATNPQQAADLCLIAHRLAEQALVPGLVAQDGYGTTDCPQSLLQPERELIAAYLGGPEEPIEAPTPAQRLLFGQKRRRIPELWSVDHPLLSGAPHGQDSLAQAVAAQGPYFFSHLAPLADAAMAEFGRLTGRAYGRVATHRVEDADYLIVAQGSAAPAAEAAADYLRKQRRLRVGVVTLTMWRPFPGDLLGHLLQRRKGVAVLERLEQPLAEDPPLMRELRATVGKCVENGRAKQGAQPFAGYAAYGRPEDAPPLFSAAYGLGGREVQSEGLIGAVENMLPAGAGRRRVFLSLDFLREPGRSPKEEIFLQTLADAYPSIRSLRAVGSENPPLLPKKAITVRLDDPVGRPSWSARENLGRTLLELKGLHSKAFPEPGPVAPGAPASLHVVAAPEPVRAGCAPAAADVVLAADPQAFTRSDPLAGLAEEGTLILQTGLTSEQAVWEAIPERSRAAILARRIRLYFIDALAIAGEEARRPGELYPALGRVLQGCALATPAVAAATGLAGKPLLRGLREMVRLRGEGDPGVDTEAHLAAFRRGTEELTPVTAMPPPAAAEAVAHPVALPTVLKTRPADPVPVMDIHRFWEETGIGYARGQAAGPLAEPFLGSGLIPAATGVLRDLAPSRLVYPQWLPQKCTGCGECWMVCPDSALPGLVTGVGELLEAVLERVEASGSPVQHLPRAVRTLEGKLRERIAGGAEGLGVGEHITAAIADTLAASKLGAEQREALEAELTRFAAAWGGFPLAVTEPYFSEPEKAAAGEGGLLSVTLDPSKCKACMACVAACPEEALAVEPQSDAALADLRRHWELWLHLPTTAATHIRTQAGAPGAPGLETLLLDKRAYHAMTGGDDSAPGAAEKTVLHLFAAAVEGLMQPRVAAQLVRLGELIEKLGQQIRLRLALDVGDPQALQQASEALREKEFTLAELSEKIDREKTPVDAEWLKRVTGQLAGLQQLERLYRRQPGQPGRTALGMVHGSADGEHWGLAYPYNPFPFPWTGHQGHGSPALAMGLFEGHMARMADGFKAIRMTELELEEQYNSEVHDPYFARFGWREFSEEEFLLCPPVVVVGGDKALYGAGQAGLSALLRSGRPLKVLCLDSQAHAHLAGLAAAPAGGRWGGATAGPHAARRELALAGMAPGGPYLAQSSLANLPHLMGSFAEGLAAARPALFNVYCSRPPDGGQGSELAVAQSRLALQSRAHPLYRFNPAADAPLHECLSLEGNPDPERSWPSYTLTWLDEGGQAQTMDLPMTPADFAATLPGLEHHFRVSAPEDPEDEMQLLADYLELDEDEREEALPFVWALNPRGGRQRLLVSPALVQASQERKRFWQTLRTLTRGDIVPVDEEALSEQVRAEMVEKVAQNLLELSQNGQGLPGALMDLAAPGSAEEKTKSGEPHA